MPLCSVIVHICNIYVNRKENIGIMKPMKVILCHLTATICSSPKDLMFKSLMKKKLSLILMSNYFSKEMKIANPCHVQENVMLWRILPMWMFSWGYELTWFFLVLVLVLYIVYKQMHVVCEGFIFLIVQNKSGKVIWKWIVWSLHFKREVVPVHDTLMKWKINEYNVTWNSKLQMSENKHFIKYLKNFVAERVFFLSLYASLNLQRYTSQKRAVCISWN